MVTKTTLSGLLLLHPFVFYSPLLFSFFPPPFSLLTIGKVFSHKASPWISLHWIAVKRGTHLFLCLPLPFLVLKLLLDCDLLLTNLYSPPPTLHTADPWQMSEELNCWNSGTRLPRFMSWHGCLWAVWAFINCLTSLCLHFLISNSG